MRISFLIVGVLLFMASGCRHAASVYEQDDLVTIAHNKYSEYTLLVYENSEGRSRKVLRRKGVCELVLIEQDNGAFLLKERGHEAKILSLASLQAVEAHLESLLFKNNPTEEDRAALGAS